MKKFGFSCVQVLQEAKEQAGSNLSSPSTSMAAVAEVETSCHSETFDESCDMETAVIAKPTSKDFKVQFHASSRSKGIVDIFCLPFSGKVRITFTVVNTFYVEMCGQRLLAVPTSL